MTISRISFQADGNAERTTTVKVFSRDTESMASLRNSLPDTIMNHTMTMFDGNTGYFQVGADHTSKYWMDAFRPHLPEASQSLVQQKFSEAVVAAQTAAAGLDKIEGLAQIALSAAPQNVHNVGGTERSTVLGG